MHSSFTLISEQVIYLYIYILNYNLINSFVKQKKDIKQNNKNFVMRY